MTDILADAPLLTLAILIALGGVAFLISTVAGGGGALVLVPVLNALLGVEATAPVLNLGTLIGRPARLLIFWRHIQWRVVAYYAPAAIIGAWLGGYLFAHFRLEWLQVVVGVFLVSTVWQYRFGKRERSFPMRLGYFIPLGLLVSVLGTIIGALGPILNPFYLNLGLDKEDLVATKTANSFLMGLSQLGSYTFFGLLTGELWTLGLALGVGATAGNLLGKRFLGGMKSITFRRILLAFMFLSGLLLIYGQLKPD
ncbi:hypothetical protein GGR26_000117 [Lewinella marina]|uniref:Probable membrane transporter protein n=1 Tax=Neolewinella marina TaxID=438751 RepID=A0A2G0CKH0_9BACT|nr:sulfite exporter TauE/SafE family protein [Neolewinella marina]NJB84372.1 hypothetical protein [Neolewinella marina]PHL00431.1 hypothetical protein CGL56_05200 [Neolewinella marina]